MEIDSHRIEPGLFEQLEMPGLKPRAFARTPDGVVAYDVYASPEPAILFEHIHRAGLRTNR
jgi:hypothetical protein